ncbi:hypothetical protein [Methanobrevibacter sp.]
MKYIKLMLVTLVLLAILTIGAVSASDDVSSDNLTVSDDVDEVSVDASVDDEIISDSGDEKFAAADVEFDLGGGRYALESSESDILSNSTDINFNVISLSASDCYEGETATVIYHGPDGEAQITVSGVTYTIVAQSGFGVLELYDLAVGSYSATCGSASTTFNVLPRENSTGNGSGIDASELNFIDMYICLNYAINTESGFEGVNVMGVTISGTGNKQKAVMNITSENYAFTKDLSQHFDYAVYNDDLGGTQYGINFADVDFFSSLENEATIIFEFTYNDEVLASETCTLSRNENTIRIFRGDSSDDPENYVDYDGLFVFIMDVNLGDPYSVIKVSEWPEGIADDINITLQKDGEEAVVTSWNLNDVDRDGVGYAMWNIEQLQIQDEGTYLISFGLTVNGTNKVIETGSVNIGSNDDGDINLWVNTEDEFSTATLDDLREIFASVRVPEGTNGNVTFTIDGNVLYNLALSDFDDGRIDYERNIYNIALEVYMEFIFEGLNSGDVFKFAFLDEDGNEVKSQEYFIYFGEGTVRFEINAHNPGDHVNIDVLDEVSINDGNDFVWINLPSDVTDGKVIVTSGDYTLFEESVNFEEGSHWWTEVDGHYVCSFSPNSLKNWDKLHTGDIVTFAFIDENEEETSKEYMISFEDDTVRFEGIDDDEESLINQEEIITNTYDDNYDPNVIILTLTDKSIRKIIISDTLDVYTRTISEIPDEGYNVYLKDLDLNNVADKTIITFVCYDENDNVVDDFTRICSVKVTDDTIQFFEIDEESTLELYAFYGNLTTGDLNGPELMGWHPNGNFIQIVNPHPLDEITVTVNGGDFTKTYTRSDLVSEYDPEGNFIYSMGAYVYSIILTDEIIHSLPENEIITFNFVYGDVNVTQKRIMQGDYLYKVITPDDILWLFNITINDDELDDVNDVAVNIRANYYANRQSIFIELGGGYFSIYVDDVKVEGLGRLIGQTELELFNLCGEQDSWPDLNITLSDLGITVEDAYTIWVKHYPSDEDTAEYQYIQETEILSKDITFSKTVTPTSVDPQLTIAPIDDVEEGSDVLIRVTANETFNGDVKVFVGDYRVGIVNMVNGHGNVTILAGNFSIGSNIVKVTSQANETFNAGENTVTVNVTKKELSKIITMETFNQYFDENGVYIADLDEIVFSGDFTGIPKITISKAVNITGQGAVFADTLFNINADNVVISDLTINTALTDYAVTVSGVKQVSFISNNINAVNGILISDCTNFIIDSNTIISTAGENINGIYINGTGSGVVRNNNLDLKSTKTAYAINTNPTGPLMVSYINNTIVAESYFAVGIYDDAEIIKDNKITLLGNYAIGIAVLSENAHVEGNGITLTTTNTGDVDDIDEPLGVESTGIKVNNTATITNNNVDSTGKSMSIVGGSSTISENTLNGKVSVESNGNTISNNVITTTEDSAIDASSAIGNTITSNEAYSAQGNGDNAVKAGEGNTVNGNFEKFDPALTISVANIIEGADAVIVITTNNTFSGNVAVQIGEAKYNVSVVNGDGNKSVSDLGVNNYTAIATFDATDVFTASTKNTTFVVNPKVATALSASPVTTTYATSKNVVVTLKDANGNVLAGKKVTIVLNGASKTVNTNGKGQATLAIGTALAPKTYYAKFTFAGDSAYLKSTGSVKVTVKKATPKLTAKKKTFKVKMKTKKYTITLKTNKGKAFNKVKVSIVVKGKKYTATVKKGKATFNLKKLTKKGTYKATVTFAGNKYYNKVTVKNVKITVKK